MYARVGDCFTEEKLQLQLAIETHGGEYSPQLDKSCTHLVAKVIFKSVDERI
jgi:hypothetical protein